MSACENSQIEITIRTDKANSLLAARTLIDKGVELSLYLSQLTDFFSLKQAKLFKGCFKIAPDLKTFSELETEDFEFTIIRLTGSQDF